MDLGLSCVKIYLQLLHWRNINKTEKNNNLCQAKICESFSLESFTICFLMLYYYIFCSCFTNIFRFSCNTETISKKQFLGPGKLFIECGIDLFVQYVSFENYCLLDREFIAKIVYFNKNCFSFFVFGSTEFFLSQFSQETSSLIAFSEFKHDMHNKNGEKNKKFVAAAVNNFKQSQWFRQRKVNERESFFVWMVGVSSVLRKIQIVLYVVTRQLGTFSETKSYEPWKQNESSIPTTDLVSSSFRK